MNVLKHRYMKECRDDNEEILGRNVGGLDGDS